MTDWQKMIIEGNGKDLIQKTNLDVRIAIWKFMYINIQQFIRYTSIRVWTVYIMGGNVAKKKHEANYCPERIRNTVTFFT